MTRLSGGCIAETYKVALDDGRRVVAKFNVSEGSLSLEGWMLRYLQRHSRLPVPAVLHADDRLLVIDYVATSGGITPAVERHAAELLAALHQVTAPAYGLERDTLIGPLPQPNPESADWLGFFRDHRLLHMAGLARDAGRLPGRLMHRIEWLAGRLERWIEAPAPPSLIHGDMWAGNLLARDGRVAGFVDPAIYYADPEIELAFATLFGTFGTAFFERYGALQPLRPGFFEVRRELYNLYPLLVHLRLFGGAYLAQVTRTLDRFGA
jgi:fructosamine-3-kinase